MIQEGFEAIITEVVTSLAFVTNLHVCVCNIYIYFFFLCINWYKFPRPLPGQMYIKRSEEQGTGANV